jgi:hypothetical protein
MRAVFVVAVWATAASISVQATTVLPADLSDLVRDAHAVAQGQVVAIDAAWTSDHRAIETLVTLRADAYLKGQLGPTLQFRVPGGRLGRFDSVMIGAPTFSVGQNVVVFLGARGPSVPYLLGLGQGVFRLVPGAGGWLVTPPALLPSTSGRTSVVRGDVSRRPVPLADFSRQVRSLAGSAR